MRFDRRLKMKRNFMNCYLRLLENQHPHYLHGGENLRSVYIVWRYQVPEVCADQRLWVAKNELNFFTVRRCNCHSSQGAGQGLATHCPRPRSGYHLQITSRLYFILFCIHQFIKCSQGLKVFNSSIMNYLTGSC